MGILRQLTCRCIVQQNGVVERKIRHILKIARALVFEKDMPCKFWVEAMFSAVYIMNWSSTAAIRDVIVEEKFTGKRRDFAPLKVFGCIAYVHILDACSTNLMLKLKMYLCGLLL